MVGAPRSTSKVTRGVDSYKNGPHEKSQTVQCHSIMLNLFVGGHTPYLRYLCLFTHIGVQHILCCVFVLSFFVLCTLCYQFLWIVHFWLHLRYSLTFICIIYNLSTYFVFGDYIWFVSKYSIIIIPKLVKTFIIDILWLA